MKRFHWLLPISIAVTVAYLSLQRVSDLPPLFPHADKAFHLLAYAVLAFSTLRSFWRWHGFSRRDFAIVMAGVAAYGAGLEGLQMFLPFRSAEALDLIANLSGAMLGVYTYGQYKRRLAPDIGRGL